MDGARGNRHGPDQRARFTGHGGTRYAVQVQVHLSGAHEKIPILQEIVADAKIAPEEVAYIGDDFTDGW